MFRRRPVVIVRPLRPRFRPQFRPVWVLFFLLVFGLAAVIIFTSWL